RRILTPQTEEPYDARQKQRRGLTHEELSGLLADGRSLVHSGLQNIGNPSSTSNSNRPRPVPVLLGFVLSSKRRGRSLPRIVFHPAAILLSRMECRPLSDMHNLPNNPQGMGKSARVFRRKSFEGCLEKP